MIAAGFANRILATLEPTIQLHTGHPGPEGLLMAAEGAAARTVTFTEPVDGQVFNADVIAWLGVTMMEHYTHFTAWDGNGLLFIGTVSAPVVYAGDNVVVDRGGMVAFFDVAAPTPS